MRRWIWQSFLLLALALSSAGAHDGRHPYGSARLDWPAEHIARTLTTAQDFQNEAVVVAWHGPGNVENIEGRRCLVGGLFLFDVDDDYAFDIDEPVTLELLLDRRASRGFIAIYDRAGAAPAAQPAELAPEGGRWQRVQVLLDRARFANRLQGGTDFGVAAPGTGLFYDPDADHEIALCGLQVRRSGRTPPPPGTGTLELAIRDRESGAPLAARVGLYDESGRAPLPSEKAVIVHRFDERVRQLPLMPSRELWPGPGRWIFYADGEYQTSLPAGRYEVIVARGPEYRVARRRIVVRPGENVSIDIALQRWVDMPSQGWYSGDGHVHIRRERAAENREILAQMRAEDLHVTNLLQMSNVRFSYYPQYAFGPEGQYVEGTHALVSGQESPRTGHRGHTVSLHITRYHGPERYFLYHELARAVRRDGGLYGYAHVMFDAFHASRGLALDVPMALVDFIEVLQFGELGTEVWYDFLNLGFLIHPMAGSDFPYISAPGTERTYVRIEGEFTPAAWFDGLRAGRAFVTSGPLLELSVAGRGMGERIEATPGTTLPVRASARVNPDYETLERIELVVHGEVVASRAGAEGDTVLTLKHDLPVRQSCWVALRAYGRNGTAAHSSPLVITVGGSPSFWKREAVPELIERYRDRIDELLSTEPLPREDLEKWETSETLLDAWHRQREALSGHASEVLRRYDELAESHGANP